MKPIGKGFGFLVFINQIGELQKNADLRPKRPGREATTLPAGPLLLSEGIASI